MAIPLLLAFLVLSSRFDPLPAVEPTAGPALLDRRDGAILIDPRGRAVFSANADLALIPASTLKILTALVALHHLGPAYRFVTEFYLDQASNLKVKGYGDPLLVSEVLAEIAHSLQAALGSRPPEFNDLLLDDTHFGSPLTIPGITSSTEPYDAPNGALNVNFNTVFFTRDDKGVYISAERQTPLLGYALKRITATGLESGRIVLTNNEDEATLYAGHLIGYFLGQRGIRLSGVIAAGRIEPEKDRLVFRYASRYSLAEVLAKLLEHSSNFVANQVLIATGARMYDPPGSLAKGVRTMSAYATDILNIENIAIAEGSGISRENRMSVSHMARVLAAFEPYHGLLQKAGREYYKTGTLKGIRTRAGYIEDGQGKLYRFAVFVNTPGQSIDGIMATIRETASDGARR